MLRNAFARAFSAASLAAFVIAAPALADNAPNPTWRPGEHPHGSHDPYTKWVNPRTKQDCCHARDCGAVPKEEIIFRDGLACWGERCIPIDEVEDSDILDGMAHPCIHSAFPDKLRCLKMPMIEG